MGAVLRLREVRSNQNSEKRSLILIKGTGAMLGEEFAAIGKGRRAIRRIKLFAYAKAGRGSNKRRKTAFSGRPPLGRKVPREIPFRDGKKMHAPPHPNSVDRNNVTALALKKVA